jgi:adenylate cyclase class 2
MNTEYEALFCDLDIESLKKKLISLGGNLVCEKTLQKRTNLHLPISTRDSRKWLRVRTKGDKTTLALKMILDQKMQGQKELEFDVPNYDKAVELLENIGCEVKAEQESYREIWAYKNIEITFDEWPFLEPYIEIEGQNEESVVNTANELGLDWKNAKFCTASKLYADKYGVTENYVENEVKSLIFGAFNPFIK